MTDIRNTPHVSSSIRRRAGFALVDTVGVIVTTGILLSFASIVLGRAFVSNVQALGHLQHMRQLQNAHARFVGDVHRAIRCEVQVDGLVLELGDGRSIRYQSLRPPEAIATQNDPLERSNQPAADDAQATPVGLTLSRIMAQGNEELGRDELRLDKTRQIAWAIDREERIPVVRCELIDDKNVPLVWLSRMELLNLPLATEIDATSDVDPDLAIQPRETAERKTAESKSEAK